MLSYESEPHSVRRSGREVPRERLPPAPPPALPRAREAAWRGLAALAARAAAVEAAWRA